MYSKRVLKFRNNIITWLNFYNIPNLQNKNDDELIEELIARASGAREYSYGQNNAFEWLFITDPNNPSKQRT